MARLMTKRGSESRRGRVHQRHHGHLHQPAPREGRRPLRVAEVTTGGKALKFYASVRLDVRSPAGNRLKEGTEPRTGKDQDQGRQEYGRGPVHRLRVRPIYGHGIDATSSVIDAAEAAGVLLRLKSSSA